MTAGIAAHAAIYNTKSVLSFYGHVKQNIERDEEATALHSVPIHLIHRASSRYLYVRDAELDFTPKRALPAATMVEESSVSANLRIKVEAFASRIESSVPATPALKTASPAWLQMQALRPPSLAGFSTGRGHPSPLLQVSPSTWTSGQVSY